jgi:hypothetical protein
LLSGSNARDQSPFCSGPEACARAGPLATRFFALRAYISGARDASVDAKDIGRRFVSDSDQRNSFNRCLFLFDPESAALLSRRRIASDIIEIN